MATKDCLAVVRKEDEATYYQQMDDYRMKNYGPQTSFANILKPKNTPLNNLWDKIQAFNIDDYIKMHKFSDQIQIKNLWDKLGAFNIEDNIKMHNFSDLILLKNLWDKIQAFNIDDYIKFKDFSDQIRLKNLLNKLNVFNIEDNIKFKNFSDQIQLKNLWDEIQAFNIDDYIKIKNFSNNIPIKRTKQLDHFPFDATVGQWILVEETDWQRRDRRMNVDQWGISTQKKTIEFIILSLNFAP